MRFRKIVTGILVASSLTMSMPVLAAPAPDTGMMLEGDGGGFQGGMGGLTLAELLLTFAALTLSIIAIVDSSKSP